MEESRAEQLAPTVAALRTQHLEHWKTTDTGQEALERLKPLIVSD